MSCIGVFGGTFNPPHIGHLICAQAALIQLQLERVVFVPAGEPPHKLEPQVGRERRYELCQLAVAGDQRFEVSRLEIERTGPSYTCDTLQALHEQAPERELSFIIGADMALSLPEWHRPEEVLRLAKIAIVERSGISREEVVTVFDSLAAADRIEFFAMPVIGISSTMIRERMAADRPVQYLSPDAVVEYAQRHSLYRKEVVS